MKTFSLDFCESKAVKLSRPTNSEKADFVVTDSEGNVVLALKDDNCFAVDDDMNPIQALTLGHDDMARIDEAVRELVKEELDGIENDSEGDGADDDSDDQQPFNPNDIQLVTRVVTMDTLIRRLEQGKIVLNPDFQRNEVWDNERKSRLIESLFLRIPIPMFYVSSDSDDNWTVVDGQQRISTLRDFILGREYVKTREQSAKGYGLKLESLEFWKEYNGYCFNELPVTLQNRVMETEFNFTIINPPTPEDVKLNIFKRINTGGMHLSFQEIRNALYIGPSTTLLKKLADSAAFKSATDNSIHADRKQDQELVLRMLAFMVRSYESYTRTVTSDDWLSQTMILLNYLGCEDTAKKKSILAVIERNKIPMGSLTTLSHAELEKMFVSSMQRAKKLFGRYAFRKSYMPLRRTPINKSLFEVWGIILAMLTDDEFATLCRNKSGFEQEYHRLLQDPDFILAISRDSMKWQSVYKRYDNLMAIVNRYAEVK